MTNRCEESELSKVSPVPGLPKLYSAPTLTVFGAVARLTKGSGKGLPDADGLRPVQSGGASGAHERH